MDEKSDYWVVDLGKEEIKSQITWKIEQKSCFETEWRSNHEEGLTKDWPTWVTIYY